MSSSRHLTKSLLCVLCLWYLSYSNKTTVLLQLSKFLCWYFCSSWWKTWIISLTYYHGGNSLFSCSHFISFALQVLFQFPYRLFYFLRWCFCNLKPLQKLTTLCLLNYIFCLPLVPRSPSFNFITSFSCWHRSYFLKLLSLHSFWLCCCLKIIFHASASVKLVLMLFHCYYFWYECSKGIFVLLEIPMSSEMSAWQVKRKICGGTQF